MAPGCSSCKQDLGQPLELLRVLTAWFKGGWSITEPFCTGNQPILLSSSPPLGHKCSGHSSKSSILLSLLCTLTTWPVGAGVSDLDAPGDAINVRSDYKAWMVPSPTRRSITGVSDSGVFSIVCVVTYSGVPSSIQESPTASVFLQVWVLLTCLIVGPDTVTNVTLAYQRYEEAFYLIGQRTFLWFISLDFLFCMVELFFILYPSGGRWLYSTDTACEQASFQLKPYIRHEFTRWFQAYVVHGWGLMRIRTISHGGCKSTAKIMYMQAFEH